MEYSYRRERGGGGDGCEARQGGASGERSACLGRSAPFKGQAKGWLEGDVYSICQVRGGVGSWYDMKRSGCIGGGADQAFDPMRTAGRSINGLGLLFHAIS